jgi:mRNA interferase MazF
VENSIVFTSLEAIPGNIERLLVCSRQILRDSRFSTVVYAPVFIHGEGLSTQVPVGPDEGLKHPGWIMCDKLVSLRKPDLTQFLGSLARQKLGRTGSRPEDGPGNFIA